MGRPIAKSIQRTPAELIESAVNAGTNLVELEKLLEIQIKYEANEARKSYAKSFSIAQANMVPVMKNKYNSHTKSKYSELADVIETAQPIYTKEGFSVTFNEGVTQLPEHARILADVLHFGGHKETYFLDVPLDGKGIEGKTNMTRIHGKASSIAYGRRYLMCMIWNIPTADNDGNTVVLEKVSDKQLHIMRDLLISKEMKEEDLIKYLKIEALEDLPLSDYMKALAAINSARKKAQ